MVLQDGGGAGAVAELGLLVPQEVFGEYPSKAWRRRRFSGWSSPASFQPAGRKSPNEIMSSSRNGTRASSPWAIVTRSALCRFRSRRPVHMGD